jgi:hypothetical protein
MSKNTLNILEKKVYIHPWSLLQSHENSLLNLKEVQKRQFFFIFTALELLFFHLF